jgi:hypothetical protein
MGTSVTLLDGTKLDFGKVEQQGNELDQWIAKHVRLKGINSITKTLADGSKRTYWYAMEGGPPLRGEPGTPEFVHSYNEAIARKVVPPQGTMLSPLRAYQASGEFDGLAPRTRADYIKHIRVIEKDFGDFPLAALTDRCTGWPAPGLDDTHLS